MKILVRLDMYSHIHSAPMSQEPPHRGFGGTSKLSICARANFCKKSLYSGAIWSAGLPDRGVESCEEECMGLKNERTSTTESQTKSFLTFFGGF